MFGTCGSSILPHGSKSIKIKVMATYAFKTTDRADEFVHELVEVQGIKAKKVTDTFVEVDFGYPNDLPMRKCMEYRTDRIYNQINR